MRAFETTSMYDKENEEWMEIYHIDGEEVDAEEYFEEMENEKFDEEECNCEDCCEVDESIEAENALIDECMEFVFDTDSCINCKIAKIIELAYKFKDIGFTDAKEYMRSCIDDLDVDD
jgi:hypothetical protein